MKPEDEVRAADAGFLIEAVRERRTYEGLRSLWCRTFGDEPAFVDMLYRCFGADPEAEPYSDRIRGYVVTNADGESVSALTCYLCGHYEDRPVYMSYAVCTDPDHRSMGLAGKLTAYVRDEVLEKGGISAVSPAEESLEAYYGNLGYERYFFTDNKELCIEDDDGPAERMRFLPGADVSIYGSEDNEDADFFEAELSVRTVTAGEYIEKREKLLRDVPHITPAIELLELVREDSAGGDGLALINEGDAVCIMKSNDEGTLYLEEFLLDPALMQISEEIEEETVRRLACHERAKRVIYRAPGIIQCQTMAAGISGSGAEGNDAEERPYYGFPID